MSTRTYKIHRQFGWISSGRVLAAVIQAVTLVMLIRSVDPATFGIVSAALGAIVVAQTGFDLGIPALAARERAVNPNARVIGASLRLNTITSLILLLVLTCLALALGTILPVFYTLAPLALSAAAERVADARLAIAIADGDAHLNTSVLVGRRALALSMLLGALYATQMDPVFAFSLAMAISALGSMILAIFSTRGRIREHSQVRVRTLLRAANPYWINSLATQLRNLDTVIAAWLAGAVQGGYYGAAARLSTPLRIPATSLGAALLPAAARVKARSEWKPLLRVVAIALVASTVAYGVLIPLCPYFIPILLGADYMEAVPVVQVVLAGLPFAAAVSMLAALLQGMGRKKTVAVSAVGSTLVCLCLVVAGSLAGLATFAALGLAVSFVVQALVLSVALAHCYQIFNSEAAN